MWNVDVTGHHRTRARIHLFNESFLVPVTSIVQ